MMDALRSQQDAQPWVAPFDCELAEESVGIWRRSFLLPSGKELMDDEVRDNSSAFQFIGTLRKLRVHSLHWRSEFVGQDCQLPCRCGLPEYGPDAALVPISNPGRSFRAGRWPAGGLRCGVRSRRSVGDSVGLAKRFGRAPCFRASGSSQPAECIRSDLLSERGQPGYRTGTCVESLPGGEMGREEKALDAAKMAMQPPPGENQA